MALPHDGARRAALAASLALLVVLPGCPGGDAPPAGDGGVVPTCEAPPPPFVHGGDGHADPLGAGPGEARAGRLSAAMLPTSATGLETWAAGDLVLANDRVALLLEDVGPSDLYDPYGGRPVGVALVEGGALVRPADFNEVLFGLSTFLVRTERVSVVADGSGGGPAVVRATGPLAPIEFAGDLLDLVSTSTDLFEGWSAAVDYALAPGADAIEVTLRVLSPEGRPRTASNLLLGIFQHSRMQTYVPSVMGPAGPTTGGFEERMGDLPYVAFDDDHGGAGWGWRAPSGRTVRSLLEISGVNVMMMGPAPLAGCAQNDVALGSIVIGPGLAGVSAAIARADGVALRTLTGTVTEADGTTPAPDARVHVEVDGTYYTRTRVAADGTYAVEIPAAGTARVSAYRRAFPPVSADAPAGPDPVVALAMPAFGTVHVTVTEGGAPAPARVQILPTSGEASRPPGAWGEPTVTGGREHVEFAVTGEASARVPPGTWRVVVSRGYEYELEDFPTTVVAAGATTEIAATLRHTVDTTGVMCADYHIHTTRSPDSEDPGDRKIAALVADGLEIAVRSDHDFVADFAPEIEAMGLGDWVLGIPGEELTTFTWGHFGLFPLVPDPSVVNGSAIPWVGRTPPETFAEARARPERPTLIINHPRTGAAAGGYFTAASYDPTTGVASNAERWDESFTVVEVFNDTSFEENRARTVRDWFSLLQHGRRVFAVGSSDSHHLYGAPVGYPRTCLALGTDDPRAIDAEDVSDATDAGRSYVSGGIYLDVEGPGGEGPGATIAGAGAVVSFHVVVRAAEWIDVDALEVIVDGATTETIPLGPAPGADPTVRFDDTIDVPVATSALGTWAIFHAHGDRNMSELHPGRAPFAVSNPVFLTR